VRLRRNSQSGVAILTVLVSMAILTILAFELSFSTGVQSRLTRTFHEWGQAKYLAKSAQNLSLVRVYVYLNLLNMISEIDLPIGPESLAQVYSVPLPPFPFDESMLGFFPVAVRIGLEKFSRESKMGEIPRAQFSSDIRGLSGKIPLNFLDGEPERFSSRKFQKVYSEMITKIISETMEVDEAFYDKYQEHEPEEFTWGLIDYIDLDNVEQSVGLLEDLYFQQFIPPEFLRHRRYLFMEDIALAKTWDDALVQKFGKLFNLYAFYPYINVNKASSEVLKIIFSSPEKEQLEALEEKISTEAFKSYKDIQEFRELQDLRLEDDEGGDPFKKLITYHEQTAFKINAQGIIGDTVQDTTTIIVLKPSEKTLKQVSRDVRRKINQYQKKIEKQGERNDPEFTAYMEDPFHFFSDPEDEQEEAEEEEVEKEDKKDIKKTTSDKKDKNKPKKKKKQKEKIIKIFEEAPAQFKIAYWGDPV
jgi:hypothetical protein